MLRWQYSNWWRRTLKRAFAYNLFYKITMDKLIEVKNVTFMYDEENEPGIKALDNINLEIYKGEFLGIAGRNGSGKSTLAKLLNGLHLPNRGDVFVMGQNTKDENKLLDIRKTVGMVFQNPDNQMVATIVEEDVAFGPENLGLPREKLRQLVDESLKAVGMEKFKDKKPHKLSGGQKQRVAIAGVLAMHPDLIVLDEATAMLDPSGRKEVLATVKRLNQEGVSIVMITHYMEELTEADRIIVIDEGKCVLEGPPCEVFRKQELLEQMRLGVPEIVEISNALRREGVKLSNNILTMDELVDELCRLA